MIIVKVFNDSNNELPKYETADSAGLDVRADLSHIETIADIKIYGPGQIIPANSVNAVKMIALEPGSRTLIPTGLYVELPSGYEAQVRPRSGLALKEGIIEEIFTFLLLIMVLKISILKMEKELVN